MSVGSRGGRLLTALAIGVLAVLVVACGAGVRPTVTPTRGTAVPAGGPPTSATGRKQYSAPPPMTIDPNKQYTAIIKTNLGDITVDLDAKNAPVTVNNFVFLAREGFYDGTPFHRVIKGFMIQGGDPTGTGTGGPGYRFPDEPVKGNYDIGSVAMANSGPNTNGSQFFICEGEQCKTLPPKYNLFGKVVDGMDVVHQIAGVPTTGPERSSPTQVVQISTIQIIEH